MHYVIEQEKVWQLVEAVQLTMIVSLAFARMASAQSRESLVQVMILLLIAAVMEHVSTV